MNEIDQIDLEIECPTCGKKIKNKVAWFKRDQHCPHGCGTVFKTGEFRSAIEECERKLADTRRKLAKSFKINIKL